jgi:hypothetical protein
MNDNLLLDHVHFAISRPSFDMEMNHEKRDILKLYALDERFGGELLVADN